MNLRVEQIRHQTRRQFLRASGQFSLGAIALQALGAAPSPVNPLAPRPSHYVAKVKRVIYLHMSGGPPHLDLFDYKPELVKRDGQPAPDDFIKGRRFAFTTGTPLLMGTPRQFAQYGRSGMWMSDAVPHFHGLADDLCLIKSMHTDQFNHTPAELLLFTGSPRGGRPSMGSWVTYGLGSENADLPGFVDRLARQAEVGGSCSVPDRNGAISTALRTNDLPTLLRGIIFVGEPALGPRLDLKRVSLRPVRGGDQAVVGVLRLRQPGGALRHVVDGPGHIASFKHLGRRARVQQRGGGAIHHRREIGGGNDRKIAHCACSSAGAGAWAGNRSDTLTSPPVAAETRCSRSMVAFCSPRISRYSVMRLHPASFAIAITVLPEAREKRERGCSSIMSTL